MSDLQQRLEALANRGDPRGASDVLHRARRSIADDGGDKLAPHASRRRIIALVAAAATILAIAGGAVLLVRDSGDGEPRVVATGGIDTEDQDASMTGAPLFLVPRTVPDGFQLLRASGGDQPGISAMTSGSSEWDRTQRWVRFDAAHERPVEILDIQWGPGATVLGLPGGPQGSDDVLSAFRSQSIPVEVRGHDGLYSEENGWLAWEEPAGQAVLVSGTTPLESTARPISTPLALDFLMRVADTLEPRSDGGFELRAPPDGFELVAEWPGFASEGTNPRTLIYQGADGRGFQLHIVDATESPPGINLSFSSARVVDVGGHEAVLTPSLFAPPGGFDQQTLFMLGADRFVQWLESEGTRVTISGVGLSDSEILNIARDLETVDAETWFGLQGGEPPQMPAAGPSELPEPDGPPPSDEAEAREQVIQAVEVASAGTSTAEEREASIENGEGQDALRQEILVHFPDVPVDKITARVDEVRFLNRTTAAVRYTIVLPGYSTPEISNRIARVVLVDGTWKVTRESACNDLLLGGVTCPP